MGTEERKKGKMASNNSKYTPEYRKEICQLIISSGRSATSIAEEMGIDKNAVCSWMRDYRRQNQLPTYAEEKGIQRSVREEDAELKRKNWTGTELYKRVKSGIICIKQG